MDHVVLAKEWTAKPLHQSSHVWCERRTEDDDIQYALIFMEPMKPMSPMQPMQPMKPMEPMKAPERWWPENLGESPSSAGGQNQTRYAFFGDARRLAVDTGDGNVRVYDTGDHRISGVQQQQSGSGKKVAFSSQNGEVDLDSLRPV